MKQKSLNVLLAASSLTLSAALISPRWQSTAGSGIGSTVSSSRRDGVAHRHERTGKTSADYYYTKHGSIPKPTNMHIELPIVDGYENDDDTNDAGNQKKGILVIGDVHGCHEEMLRLHEKAISENDNQPFRYVILVGDLCNKGPSSVKVIQFVRNQEHWLAVRGNHDDSALAAALGDPIRRAKKSYQWVIQGENLQLPNDQSTMLSDEDVIWLSELPYSIRIPGTLLGGDDAVVVHAGFVPGVPIQEQSIASMVTLREVQEDVLNSTTRSSSADRRGEKCNSDGQSAPIPWASVWKGPPRIIFGHDARRGFQRYPDTGDWAIGLDSGCCYGKQLTGIILPERKIVQVEALKTYSPIVRK